MVTNLDSAEACEVIALLPADRQTAASVGGVGIFWNESRRGTAPTPHPSRAGNSTMMRRGKRTSNPVCSRAPALRQKAVLIKKPEAPVDCSSLDSPASNDNPQGDSFQPPESKLPPYRVEELPLPPFLSESADGCRDLGAAAPLGTMLNFFRSIPTQMDYKGQKLAEQIFQGVILFSAVVGFIYGYITEQFGWTVYIVMAGFAISCLLTLPPWPIYRRNPLKWLPVQESAIDDKKPADRKVKRHPKN